MSNRDPNFDAYVLQIHEVLDRLDYYRLLGVEKKARIPEIKKAFHAIAAKFHPDRNRDADPAIQDAIYDIFKRLNEAYRVLCDHERRAIYDRALATGSTRLDESARRRATPKTPEETISSPQARQFYRQAAEALKASNLMQAELHIKVAQSREKGNEAIEALVQEIQQRKKAEKKG